MMGFKKRGQITVFIIIAIVILFASAIYFYLSRYEAESTLEPEVEQTIIVPKLLEPINTQITECMNKVAIQGLLLAGQNAGYIYTEQFEKPVEDLYDGDMLETFPNGGQYVPYWVYNKDDIAMFNVPEIDKANRGDGSIQDQLEEYLRENLEICFGGFTNLASQGFKLEELYLPTGEKFDVDIIFTQEDVRINLNYPIRATKEDTSDSMNQFRSTVQIRFRHLYDLAKSISQEEWDHYFLEVKTLDVMEPYQSMNEQSLPPFSEPTRMEDCSGIVIWDMEDIKNKMNYEILQWLQMLRVNRTKNYFEIPVEDENPDAQVYTQQFYDNLMISLDDNASYSNVNVNIKLYNTRQFSINSQSFGPLFPTTNEEINLVFFTQCLNSYRYFYSFKFPILFILTDNKPGSDFILQFPMIVYINNNVPGGLYTNPIMQLNGSFEAQQLECAREARRSGEITVKVQDKFTLNDVDNANIYYKCGVLGQKCFIGSAHDEGVWSVLQANFPQCPSGGTLIIEKPDYLSHVSLQRFEREEEKQMEAQLTPLKQMKLSVKKYSVVYDEGTCTIAFPTPVELGTGNFIESEAAFFDLKKIDLANGIYSGFVEPYYSGEDNYIKIAPGQYSAQLRLLKVYSTPWNIPCQDFNGVCLPPGGTDIEQYFSGGGNITFTVTESDLAHDKIVFYVTDEPNPTTLAAVNSPLSHVADCVDEHPALLNKVDFTD